MDDEKKEIEEKEVSEDLATDEQAEGMDDRIFNKLSELYDTIDKMQKDIDDRFDRVSKIMIDSGAVVREVEDKADDVEEVYEALEDLDFTL